MKYGVYIKVWTGSEFKWARPWTYNDWPAARDAAKAVRATGAYEAVVVRKIPNIETKVDQ